MRVVRFERVGLIVKSRFGSPLTIAYGEILSAERLRRQSGLQLHTRTFERVRLRGRRNRVSEVEAHLRELGVPIVDSWGAVITPTLEDFERELAMRPRVVRQSSDNASSRIVRAATPS